MPDDNNEAKKRKTNTKYKTSYSNMTLEQAEAGLGPTINLLDRKSIPVGTLLNCTFKGVGLDAMSNTKELVYDLLTWHILIKGYPGNNTDCKGRNAGSVNAVVADAVYTTGGHTRRCSSSKPLFRAFSNRALTEISSNRSRARDLEAQRAEQDSIWVLSSQSRF